MWIVTTVLPTTITITVLIRDLQGNKTNTQIQTLTHRETDTHTYRETGTHTERERRRRRRRQIHTYTHRETETEKFRHRFHLTLFSIRPCAKGFLQRTFSVPWHSAAMSLAALNRTPSTCLQIASSDLTLLHHLASLPGTVAFLWLCLPPATLCTQA